MHSIKLHYTEALIRYASRMYWQKKTGLGFITITALLAGIVGFRIFTGDYSWSVVALAGVVLLAVAVMALAYFRSMRRSLSRFRQLQVPEVDLQLDEDEFHLASDAGSTSIAWSQVSQVWCFEKVWLVFFSVRDFMTLPLNDLSEEQKNFIASKAEQNNAGIS